MVHNETHDELIKNAVKSAGDNSLVIAMEECSELIKEISKTLRGKCRRENLIEEMADVVIILQFLQEKLDISDEELAKMYITKLNKIQDKLIKGTFK